MASQLLSAMKSTGLWVLSYFTNNPSNRKEAHSGSKVDVEAPPSSSSSSTPSHPISSPSRQPNIQSESQTQTHLSNPIAKAFRELEMGKSFLTFILPTTTMILALHGKDSSPGVLHSMLCLLCASLVALLYGISLRDLRSKGRTKHQETSKPIKPRCRRHHFRLDSSLVINLNTSDITGGIAVFGLVSCCGEIDWIIEIESSIDANATFHSKLRQSACQAADNALSKPCFKAFDIGL
ncbi:hypothetical protein LOK49_LG10G00525 [Camellia lanceoleosa]|uniref:Uncharacterized protein n=1 Tax=Camellia lanceoleosa TaxID=1840588 RepID=A0ACC0GAP2_9ERIC|nr:hypothetical protein LOK49_LG10G00525 [Camellia lanceoleosa]